jgi:phosphoribosylanthranilate isomerase
MTYVKICGITNLEDAVCATEAEADLIGFVLYPPSPRYVKPQRVARIVTALRKELRARTPVCVGVFVNDPPSDVQSVLDSADLDLGQLHGNEAPSEVETLLPRAFKALRPATRAELEYQAASYAVSIPADVACPQFLLDAYHPRRFGGTGLPVDLSLAKWLTSRFRVLLAGGLTVETVGSVIKHVRPWGVDVSSGVERAKGLKDHGLVRAFVQTVRASDPSMDEQNLVS